MIVPAHLPDAASVRRLDGLLSTLRALPVVDGVAVAAQPEAKAQAALDDLVRSCFGDAGGSRWIVIDRPVGKWPAFRRALATLSGDEVWVAVFDGDGAFRCEDLPSLVAPVAAGTADHTIARRCRESIVLRSTDQPGVNSRLHLEAFFNTIALLVLGLERDRNYHAFDIQCGFHVLSGARCRAIANRALPYYGGELVLFVDTVKAAGRVAAVEIAVRENPPSSYRVGDIVEALLAVEFIAEAPPAVFDRALEMAPDLYEPWRIDRQEFLRDIRELVLRPARRRRVGGAT